MGLVSKVTAQQSHQLGLRTTRFDSRLCGSLSVCSGQILVGTLERLKRVGLTKS